MGKGKLVGTFWGRIKVLSTAVDEVFLRFIDVKFMGKENKELSKGYWLNDSIFGHTDLLKPEIGELRDVKLP